MERQIPKYIYSSVFGMARRAENQIQCSTGKSGPEADTVLLRRGAEVAAEAAAEVKLAAVSQLLRNLGNWERGAVQKLLGCVKAHGVDGLLGPMLLHLIEEIAQGTLLHAEG